MSLDEFGEYSRIELINYLKDSPRNVIVSKDNGVNAQVEIDEQDGERTLKIFVKEAHVE